MIFQINKNPLRIKKNVDSSQLKDDKIHAHAMGKTVSTKPDSTELQEILDWQEKNSEKIAKLIQKVNESYNGVIVPDVNYADGTFTYVALKEIDESPTNYSFLENLSHDGASKMEKFVYNKFLVCADHQKSFLVNVRLYCPKCNSICIERLHLLEHRACGYIGEKNGFVAQELNKPKCPSCNKQIKTPAKELRIPATWYHCTECKEKFDDAIIRLHCKEFNHDFDVNEARAVTIYGYTIVDPTRHEFDYSAIKSELVKLVSKLGFTVDEDYLIKGRSGHDHIIDIYGMDKKNQTIFILINKQDGEIDSRIIQVLDTAPKIAILIGHSSVSAKTKSIAAKYNVSIISSQNSAEILSETEKIITFRLKKLEGAQEK
ncbi:MAG: hypothetical protein QW177_00250 [Candidatus Nitrosotenuis sp.]